MSGDNFGMDNDDFNEIPSNISTIVDLLDTKGISWAEYQEDMPYAGFQGFNYSNQVTFANDYVRKHNPLMLFDSVTQNATRLSLIKNFTSFSSDLAAQTLPQWSFITPNMTNDGHDTDVTVAANWVQVFLSPLLKNAYFMNNTLIVLTFDEDETYTVGNRVWTVLLGGVIPPSLKGTKDNTFYTHYSMLSTVEQNWGLPSLGRWDCGANVLEIVANQTGYQNSVVDITDLFFNESYPGALSDSKYTPTWPAPKTDSVCAGGNGILSSIVSEWGQSPGTYNYTNVYPYDTVSGINTGGVPVVANFQPSSSASSTSPSTTLNPAQTSPGATNNSNSSNSSNGGLSTGAKIGIGISIPLIVIIATFLAFFLIRRRRQRSSQSSAANGDILETHDGNDEHKAELPGNKLGVRGGEKYPGKPELDNIATQVKPLAELDQDVVPIQLATDEYINHPELEHTTSEHAHQGRIDPAQLDTVLSPPLPVQTPMSPQRKPVPSRNPSEVLTSSGPLPSVSQLYPTVAEPEAENEEDLLYREQRLQERRQFLAEKERLALEEEELRRLRRLREKAKGGPSSSGQG